MHHGQVLRDDEVTENVLSGAYRLHDFAATSWLKLVERCIQFTGPKAPAGELLDALETLRCERTQPNYNETVQSSTQSSMEPIKSTSPVVHQMLCEAAQFRLVALKGNFHFEQGQRTNNPLMC
jgi:hypothetical protein